MSEQKNPLYVLKHETSGDPFKAKVGGKTLTFAHVNDVDQFALADIFADDSLSDLVLMTSVLLLGLSDEDQAALREAKPSRADVTNLFRAYEQHCGADAGESPASVD